MKKTFISLLVTMLLSNMALADNRLPKTAYGTWMETNGEVFTVSAKGLSNVNQAVRGTCKAQYAYQNLSASEVIEGIRESVAWVKATSDITAYKAYQAETYAMIKLIKPKHNYVQISGGTTCTDGEYSFIPLDARTGILISTAPESYYSLVKKK